MLTRWIVAIRFVLLHDSSGFERVKSQTIVLLMDLRSYSVFEETGRMTGLELRAAERATRWAGYADPAKGEEEPQNFFLNIRGCSLTVYWSLLSARFSHDQFSAMTLTVS